MEYVKVEVDCPKELHELLDGLKSVLESVVEAKKDGWDWATDAPAVVLANLSKLSQALDGADKLKDEFDADKAAVVRASGLFVADVLSSLDQDEDAPAEEPQA